MNKLLPKLLATAMSLILTVTVAVMSSYAWITLSEAPALEGLQISIGGGNTILIAADRTETVEGVTYHYPGVFDSTINIAAHDTYDYLQDLGGLTPVSTADGIHWFLPDYYDITDEEVLQGTAVAGQIKPISQFLLDDALTYANLSTTETDRIHQGSYVYLDFWVVSPGTDYDLRISAGDDNGGSFLIDLMRPVEVDTDGDGIMDDYELQVGENSAASSVRVGFLVNPDYVTDETMLHYQRSNTYSNRYTQLRGSYAEPGGGMVYSSGYRFTIYEPNADLHEGEANGSYLVTRPLSWNGTHAVMADVWENLTVQMSSSWKAAAVGEGTGISQMFRTAIINQTFRSQTLAQIEREFYYQYMQGQLMPYVMKGRFIQRTSDLRASVASGAVGSSGFAALDQAGATDDVTIISLEKNVPQRIRMFIWMEGQDADCVNSASAAAFALSIELAGSNERQ